MPFKKIVCGVGILLFIGLSIALAADEEKPGAFKSLAARAAKEKFAAQLTRIQQETEGKIAAARKEYAAGLLKARDEATRRADLDEANRIQASLLGVQKTSLARPALHPDWTPREVLVTKLAGTTWIMAGENRLTLLENGATGPRPDGVAARWAPIGESAIVVLYDDGWIDLWHLDERLASGPSSHAKLTDTPERKRVP